jgi:hypothetical protein
MRAEMVEQHVGDLVVGCLPGGQTEPVRTDGGVGLGREPGSGAIATMISIAS